MGRTQGGEIEGKPDQLGAINFFIVIALSHYRMMDFVQFLSLRRMNLWKNSTDFVKKRIFPEYSDLVSGLKDVEYVLMYSK